MPAPQTIHASKIPPTDVQLPDGRILRFHKTIYNEVAPDILQECNRYLGPKNLTVIAEVAHTNNHGNLLHASLAYPGHHPSWNDIKLIRQAFFPPDVDVMMVLPQEADYINAHEHCFHLWQTPTEWALQ